MRNDVNSSADKKVLGLASITSPISLLALMCVIQETIIVTALSISSGSGDFWWIAAAGFVLSLIPIAVFTYLIIRHFHKLYSPGQFGNPGDFIRVMRMTVESAKNVRLGESGKLSDALSHYKEIDKRNEDRIKKSLSYVDRWLAEFDKDEFFYLHFAYNYFGVNSKALTCIDIAISLGESSSKSFSFRSASLRKLGRTPEAIHSAKLALEIDPSSPDAIYNLARCYHSLGDRIVSERLIGQLEKMGEMKYVTRYRNSANISRGWPVAS